MSDNEYTKKFKEENKEEIKYFRDQLVAILESDIEELVKNNNLVPDEGEEPSAMVHAINKSYGYSEPTSGFSLNDTFESELFSENVSYVSFNMAGGGPTVDYIIGSNGDAFLRYSNGGLVLDEILGDYEYSPLYEIADSLFGDKFTKNGFEIDEDEKLLRNKKELGVDSFEEFITDNADIKQGDVVPFATVLAFLKENDYNLEEAVQAIISSEEFYVCNEKGEDFSPEDFVNDIKAHMNALEEVALNSDFENACSAFGINADKITEIDFDYLEDEIKEAFEQEEPEVKKVNKLKP